MSSPLPALHSAEDIRVRNLRDTIYGPSTPANWEACREHWLLKEATRWLEAEAAKDQAAAQARALSQVAPPPSPR